mmetsp:Transcript_54365/g.100404  ORF Transcript_54365/g.100404 Transcript_54365/m.100404 type:complete len:163 (+) Transcript_54365:93-581(+)
MLQSMITLGAVDGAFGNEPRDLAVMLLWASIFIVGLANYGASEPVGVPVEGKKRAEAWHDSSSTGACVSRVQGPSVRQHCIRVPLSSESLMWWQVNNGGSDSGRLRMARLALLGCCCPQQQDLQPPGCDSSSTQVHGDERRAEAKLVANLAKLASAHVSAGQ